PELRSTLLQPLRPAFDLKISMLADQFDAAGTAAEREQAALSALATSEQARARSLADFENLDVSAPGLDPSLAGQRRSLYREIAARRLRLEAALDRSGTEDARTVAIRAEIATLRRSLDQIDAQIGAASDAALRRKPAPARPHWQAAQLPADVAVIEYWLGAEQAFAWVRRGSTLTMTRLGPSADIDADALALHSALRRFGAVRVQERLSAAQRLSDRVLGPIRQMIAPARTLIFIADGALHYVPFAALRVAERGSQSFLIENHDVAVTPSMEMFMRPETPRAAAVAARRMLLVDDPVYATDDPRFGRPAVVIAQTTSASQVSSEPLRGLTDGPRLPRLPGTAQEAAAIAALLPATDTDRLDGFDATRERFLSAPLQTYRFIHVASHANTDAEIPQASALILSTVDRRGDMIDGRVLAADFMNVRLQADTVVLSACDTALGKSVAGEGLVGLRYVVLARGARSVISSLWPVSDRITAGLMVHFYSVLLDAHSSVTAAWSAATRATLAQPNADPGTWGAFMLTLKSIGEVAR
ncbi:MAG TPA: CHAT domain-containing protein, partial [Steroidobacteraceae bacterium]|nr:CHAT domain-containing protein [Steroidobacteraceae bacterium]